MRPAGWTCCFKHTIRFYYEIQLKFWAKLCFQNLIEETVYKIENYLKIFKASNENVQLPANVLVTPQAFIEPL